MIIDVRPRRPSLTRIVPGLLVGEYPRVIDVAWLRQTHAVTAVVSLQDDFDLAAKGLRIADLEDAYRRYGIALRRVPIADGDVGAVAARLDGAVEAVRELLAGGHTVLLHCNAGYNRAPTIAIAYLTAHGGLGLAEANELVRRCRPCVPYLSILERRGHS
jgi:protein-tyrosine phosphatase